MLGGLFRASGSGLRVLGAGLGHLPMSFRGSLPISLRALVAVLLAHGQEVTVRRRLSCDIVVISF
jgi:hypothetical protein